MGAITAFLAEHGFAGTVGGFLLGLAASNIPLIIKWVVTEKYVAAWIRANPTVAEAIVTELKKDVDAEVAAPASPPAA